MQIVLDFVSGVLVHLQTFFEYEPFKIILGLILVGWAISLMFSLFRPRF